MLYYYMYNTYKSTLWVINPILSQLLRRAAIIYSNVRIILNQYLSLFIKIDRAAYSKCQNGVKMVYVARGTNIAKEQFQNVYENK